MVFVPHSHLQDSHNENWPVESEDVSPFHLDTEDLTESEMAKQRQDSVRAMIEASKMLFESSYYTSDEMEEKLVALEEVFTRPLQLAGCSLDPRVRCEQGMDLQLSYRDTEQAITLMAKREESFMVNKNPSDSMDPAETLMKKHHDFEKSPIALGEDIHLET